MSNVTISQTWEVNGTPTNATSVTYSLVRNDNGATVVPAGTPLPNTATGIYQQLLGDVDGSTTYTATCVVTAAGQTYTFVTSVAPQIEASEVQWPDGFRVILNQLTALAVQITLSPNPTYAVEGHHYKKGEYLEILGRQIEQFTKLYSRAYPFEIVTRGN